MQQPAFLSPEENRKRHGKQSPAGEKSLLLNLRDDTGMRGTLRILVKQPMKIRRSGNPENDQPQ